MSEWAPSVGGGATTGRRQPADSPRPESVIPAAQHLRSVIHAVLDRDPGALQAQLDAAATALGLDRCVDEIVVPATRQLLRRPAAGQPDITADLLATEAIRTWLNSWESVAPPPLEVGPILLACGPRDRQVIELESLSLLLRYHRWPCRVLGARTPTFTLTIATQAADATAVVVMSNDGRGLPHAIVSALAVDALGVPVFVAGDAFRTPRSHQRVPGRYLGSSVSGACTLLVSTLTAAASQR